MKRWWPSRHGPAALSGQASTDDNALVTEGSDPTQSGNLDQILIIGFGPAGQRVAEGLLESHQQKVVAVDLNHDNIAIAKQYGLGSLVGDATQREILEHAGIHEAQAIVITVPDHATVRHLIHLVRDIAPEVFIIARCRYHVLHWELLGAGADEVVDEEDQLGRRLAKQVRKQVNR